MVLFEDQPESEEDEHEWERRGREEEERILAQNRQNILDSSRRNIIQVTGRQNEHQMHQ